jgi:hypothetical protein
MNAAAHSVGIAKRKALGLLLIAALAFYEATI